MNKISSMLDKVAGSLESKGLLKEAEELDVISNTIESSLTTPQYLRESEKPKLR